MLKIESPATWKIIENLERKIAVRARELGYHPVDAEDFANELWKGAAKHIPYGRVSEDEVNAAFTKSYKTLIRKMK